MSDLFSANTPDTLWRPINQVPTEVWNTAIRQAAKVLPDVLVKDANGDALQIIPNTLNESIFGEDRYEFGPLKATYYALARPLLPSWVRPMLRKVYHPAKDVENLLDWPLEDRFVRFQYALMFNVMELLHLETVEILGWWPSQAHFSFVLTHDVDTQAGHDFVRQVMDAEEKYGFRSSFNFVPEGYKVDPTLLKEVRARGFEVGVHGLKHDGRLFSSRQIFEDRARKINSYLKEWGAVGYRSPMTHRNPEWMQSLEVQYDLSFFDTDPYEPMAGGTMSIWPFFIGHFVELPYTLIQDHRYLEVLEQRSPALWLQKVDFIEANKGMVLLNTHPDYLLKPGFLDVYEAFLAEMQLKSGCWHALPMQVANWWRNRVSIAADKLATGAGAAGLPGATNWTLEKHEGSVRIHVPAA